MEHAVIVLTYVICLVRFQVVVEYCGLLMVECINLWACHVIGATPVATIPQFVVQIGRIWGRCAYILTGLIPEYELGLRVETCDNK